MYYRLRIQNTYSYTKLQLPNNAKKFEKIKSTRIPRLNKSWKCSKLCHQGKTTFEGTHIKPQLNRYGETMTKCQQVRQAIELHGIDTVSQKYKQIDNEVTKYKAPGSTE